MSDAEQPVKPDIGSQSVWQNESIAKDIKQQHSCDAKRESRLTRLRKLQSSKKAKRRASEILKNGS